VERVRVKIKQRIGPKYGPSIDLPFSIECERVLAYAAQEAERLNHSHIGTEDLLLGILHQDLCGAAQILKEVGFDLGNVHEQLTSSTTVPPIQHFLVPDAETAARRAEAAWTSHFDAATIESQRPFKVEQRFAVWIVSGSAPPESALFAFISKTGGWILAIGRGDQGRRYSYSLGEPK
jgi:ATP-dependent Clp protease ATP-binding subunit ClpA